ncbi:MAG: CRTAC1 family protein [Thermoanaerobaculia bacterium]|nr:CRTAC1 family protein [Thermoanaerobaculia bacterium]
MRGRLGAAAVLLGLAALPAAAAETPRPWLREEARPRGLLFEHRSGHSGRYLFPEIHAGGCALVDADGDGDLDAYLVQSGGLERRPASRPGNRLYLNRGDGTFAAARDSGAEDRGYGMGAAAGDFDGDGRVDLYVTNVGANVLLRNLGDGRFEDVTARARVGHTAWSSSALFFDPDLDGDLDLYVANYLNWTVAGEVECRDVAGRLDYCGPARYNTPAPDVFYSNNGDGTFTDATAAAGMDAAGSTGLGVTAGDFDGDGRPDLFVANDGMLDQLWINRGDGTFAEEAVFRGAAADGSGLPKAGMGVSAADLDDDGDLDLLVGNLAGETDSLFLNDDGLFTDATGLAGLAARSRSLTRFGLAWADFDNDGHLDLYQANGTIGRRGRVWRDDDPYAQPNLLFRGLPGPRLVEVLPRGGTDPVLVATSRAACFGDVDGDGGVDVLVVNRDAPAHLLMNRAPGRGRWLRVAVLDAAGAPALGARVTVRVGGRRLRRDVVAGYSYQASSDPTAHFGLAGAETVDEVEVRHPSGERRCLGPRAADQALTVRPGEGALCPPPG